MSDSVKYGVVIFSGWYENYHIQSYIFEDEDIWNWIHDPETVVETSYRGQKNRTSTILWDPTDAIILMDGDHTSAKAVFILNSHGEKYRDPHPALEDIHSMHFYSDYEAKDSFDETVERLQKICGKDRLLIVNEAQDL